MKPLSLLLENFRSYRQHESIEFGDSQLVALVGATGAGKSSILDAMVYALYGKRSDSAQMQDALIAHNERGMSVTFRFSVAGQVYEVYRQRRNGQALQRLTMPTGTAFVDRGEVDDQIQSLLGLTIDAFLKTVLLPQGQFAQLLLDTGPNRAKILGQVMGLTYFTALNANAKAERDRAATVKASVTGARSVLPASPAADLLEAEQQLASTRALVANLAGSIERLRITDAEITDCDTKLRALEATIAPFASTPRFEENLVAVRLRALSLAPGLTSAATAEDAAEEHRLVCEGAVNARRDAGLDGATLSSIRETLLRLESCQTERAAAQKRHDDDARDLKLRQKAVVAAANRRDTAAAQLEPLNAAFTTAQAKRDAMASSLRELKEAFLERRRRSSILTAEQAAHSKCADAVKEATIADTTATKKLTAARTALEAARGAVLAAQQADAAAFLGSHLHVGDTCPVCTAKVPKSFTPVSAGDLVAAAKSLKAAETAEQIEATARTHSQAALQSATDALATQKARVTTAEAGVAELDAHVVRLCGTVTPEKRLEELSQELLAAESTVVAAEAAASEVKQELVRTEVLFSTESTQQAALANKVADAIKALGRRDGEISLLMKTLPAAWSPTPTLSIATILERVADERRESDATDTALRQATEAKAVALGHKTELEREFEREVNRPLRSLRDQASTFGQVLGHPSPSPDISVDDAYFDNLLTAIANHRGETDAARAELVANRTALAQKRNDLIVEVGEDIVGRHATASAEVGRLEGRIEELRIKTEQVARLERSLAAITPIHDALDGITKATALNQFPEHLTNQYVIRLLGLASDYFLEMTGRFRFVPPRGTGRAADREMRVYDTFTAATMPPENLSGGEKFLASLALSLAVVDQAALAGAKIDSLFLDEGFGSLDAEFLDKAMMELRARARKGRTIWVITHLLEAARYADVTYLVERGPNGSVMRRNESDLEEPVDAAGLLTVMT